MTDVPKEAFPVLEKILEAWVNRNESRVLKDAAKDSASLGFWRDGMLAQLRLIASGDRNPETFAQLEARFNESKASVTRLFQRLKHARDELGRGRISEQIDIIVNHDQFGKSTVRREIERIIDTYKHLRPSIVGRVSRGMRSYLGMPDKRGAIYENPEKYWSDIQFVAQHLCQSIESLNFEIGRLHRMVFPE